VTTIGYARVSTTDQDLSIQEAALRAAGCEVIRTEKPDDIDAPAGHNSHQRPQETRNRHHHRCKNDSKDRIKKNGSAHRHTFPVKLSLRGCSLQFGRTSM
jgi:Resolvase, N terminal domain